VSISREGSLDGIEYIPYTFEDALAAENIKLFSGIDSPTGMLNKFKKAINYSSDANELNKSLYEAVSQSGKAKFALDLLFLVDPLRLTMPRYIKEGLLWLQKQLLEHRRCVIHAPICPAQQREGDAPQ